MKTNIIIGHSSKNQGASDENNGITEFMYNNSVAYNILRIKGNDEINIIYRNNSYIKLPSEVDKKKSDLNICLHLNAFNKSAEGSEVLSSGSKNSMIFANIIAPKMAELFSVDNRGVKIRDDGRGANMLINTKAPTVILEPFFIDNDNNLELDEMRLKEYAQLICDCIDEYKKIVYNE